jgi:hypothetical protein
MLNFGLAKVWLDLMYIKINQSIILKYGKIII